MSTRELWRAGVLARVAASTLKLGSAAALMEVSYRQAKRLYRRYRAGGAKGLKHRSAGRPSNRATDEAARTSSEEKRTVLERLGRARRQSAVAAAAAEPSPAGAQHRARLRGRRGSARDSVSGPRDSMDRTRGPGRGDARDGETGHTAGAPGDGGRAAAASAVCRSSLAARGRRVPDGSATGRGSQSVRRGESVRPPVEAARAVDAKSTRPPLVGKLQNSFPRASTGILAL